MSQTQDIYLRIGYKTNPSGVFNVVKGCFLKVRAQQCTGNFTDVLFV